MKNSRALFVLLLFSCHMLLLGQCFGQLRGGDSVQVSVCAVLIKNQDGSISYTYAVRVLPSSPQAMTAFTLEIGTLRRIEQNALVIDTIPNRNWGASLAYPTVKPDSFLRAEITWVPLDTLTSLADQFRPPLSVVVPGDSLTISVRIAALPTIQRYWASGWYAPMTVEELDSLVTAGFPENDVLRPWYSDALAGKTVSPRLTFTTLNPTLMIDSLLYYTFESRNLTWIANQSTADKYTGLYTRAKSDFQQNNTTSARARLDTVLRQIPLDSVANLTSEAYALLKFNTEYLLSQLPVTQAPSIAALTPAITLTAVGSFTLTVSGANFASGSTINWNGAGRTTTFISTTELRANTLAGDVTSADSPRVTVRNSDGSESNAVRFKVVNALPQPLRPVFNCIVQEPNGALSAWFGYENLNSGSVYIPIDPSRNKITPAPQDRGQTTVFQPGSRGRVFRVELNNQLKWHLNGAQAIANRNGTRCP
jgi:hypothetical protein